MEKSAGYYPTFASPRTSYLRKRPYHSHLKVQAPRNSKALRQDMFSKWPLKLQTLNVAIANDIGKASLRKPKAPDSLDDEDSEVDCTEVD